MNVEFRAGAVEGLRQDRLPLPPQLSRVILARRVDETGEETLEGVAAHEKPQPLPLLEMQDRPRRAQQVLFGGLEQLVARIAVEYVHQRLPGMAAGRQARALDDVGDLATKQRNIRGIRAVGGRGEQPEKAVLAGDLTLAVETLDRDIVEVTGTVHRGARSGLGHDQQLGPARVRADLRRQRRETRRDFLVLAFAQDAEARSWNDLQHVLAVDHRELVATVAQEGEVVLREPAQKILALGELFCGQRRRPLLDLAHDCLQTVAHRLPIVDRGAYVVEYPRDVRGERFQSRRFGDAVDFDVNERLAPRALRILCRNADKRPIRATLDHHDRMDDQMHGEAVAVHFHRHRIDEKWHVVVDDLDHRMRRLPAMFLQRRIEDADANAAGIALAREVPVR